MCLFRKIRVSKSAKGSFEKSFMETILEQASEQVDVYTRAMPILNG
jgi:hypothetical protein